MTALAKVDLCEGTPQEIKALAALRGLSTEGLLLAQERGLLRFGVHWNQPAWFITDGTRKVISARRLDGEPWSGNRKSVMLRGSQASWSVGIREAAGFPNIALVEGGPDLLSAHHLFCFEECARDWAAVAMLSASVSIPDDAWTFFKGKRVRIFYHDDPGKQGLVAALRWHNQLGLASDIKHICCGGYSIEGGGVSKDLNDQVHASGDWYEDARAKNMHLIINR